MRRRQLRSVDARLRQAADASPQPKVRRAFLASRYVGLNSVVLIQFSDPSKGPRGTTTRARVRPGSLSPDIAVGSPVMVMVRRGQVEVTGY